MKLPEQYMYRAIELARLGAGKVAPNPMVGAVLVYQDRIIGEGYHEYFGGPHAEPNCIANVAEADRRFIKNAVLYVTLEPCSHYGKTPPCVDQILREEIRQVFIGAQDPFPQVAGTGISKLQAAGVSVITGLLAEECAELNRRFFCFHQQKRPYLILKWAQSFDGKIGTPQLGRLLISNAYSNRLVHHWRAEEAAIMVGKNTALQDDPALTNRHWYGRSPLRILVDPGLSVPRNARLFDNSARTLVFNTIKDEVQENRQYFRISSENFLDEMMTRLFDLSVQSVLVEGGRTLSQSLIDNGLYDEIRIIENQTMIVGEGLGAPRTPGARLIQQKFAGGDRISYLANHRK